MCLGRVAPSILGPPANRSYIEGLITIEKRRANNERVRLHVIARWPKAILVITNDRARVVRFFLFVYREKALTDPILDMIHDTKDYCAIVRKYDSVCCSGSFYENRGNVSNCRKFLIICHLFFFHKISNSHRRLYYRHKKWGLKQFIKWEERLGRQLGAEHVDLDRKSKARCWTRDRSDMQKSLTCYDPPGITDTMIKIELLPRPFSLLEFLLEISIPRSRHDRTRSRVLLRGTNEMTGITCPSFITLGSHRVRLSTLVDFQTIEAKVDRWIFFYFKSGWKILEDSY